jgi:D-xylose transport system substrate-binding protein
MNVKATLMVISFALSVATGLVLARGGQQQDTDRPTGGKVLLGLSMDTVKEERWQGDRDMFVARAKELGADVLVQSANGDDTRQIADMEALISRKVQAIVMIPHDTTAMAKAVDMAHQANIPIISYDRIIQNADVDLYMSFDNIKVGELQAKFLVEHLPTPGKGRIVRIYGSKADNNSAMFKTGQDNVLKPYIDRGDIQVVHEDWADDWKPENAKKITNAAITKIGKSFDAILASNDGTAGGAVQALVEEGLAGKVMVTGQDAELVACQRIAAGTQTMTIYKPLKTLASGAAEMAYKLATKKIVVANKTVNNTKIDVPSILYDVITVTKDNLEATVIKDGFQKRADVFGSAK